VLVLLLAELSILCPMKYKNLIFDFDGVLAELNKIRFSGFHQLFAVFPPPILKITKNVTSLFVQFLTRKKRTINRLPIFSIF